MEKTIIDQIYKQNLSLLDYLKQQGEVSYAVQFDMTFKKTLLLSSASYFEEEICKIIQDFIERKTDKNDYIISLVKQKAIKRQYHTYFNWNGNNANSFFSLFGDEFKSQLSQRIKTDPDLDSAVKAFLELGNLRNCLVHQNFGNYSVDKTAEEVYKLYEQAMKFLSCLSVHFNTL